MPVVTRARRLTAVFKSVRVFKLPAKSNVASDVSIANLTLWRPPTQISTWGKPADREVEWSALFFDLVYVAAMYKLGVMVSDELMEESPDHHIFFEFSGLALQLILGWHTRTLFDCRFITKDAFHGFMHTLEIFVIAITVAYVPLGDGAFYKYRHDKIYIQGLAASLGVYHCLQLIKWVEVALTNRNEGARCFSKLATTHCLMFILAQVAVLMYLPHTELAEMTHWVSAIWVGIVVVHAVTFWYFVAVHLGNVVKRDGAPGVHRQSVPIAIGFMLHRQGEWTMLLLGEGVLSMLNTVEAEHSENMFFFVQALAIVFCLFFLSFSTYPHDRNQHVMRRSRTSGIKYTIIVAFLLPLALVSAATGAKALQKLRNYEVTKGSEYFNKHYETSEANRFFCYGLQWSFVSVTLMSLYHTIGPWHYILSLFCCSPMSVATGGSRARREVMYYFVMRACTMVVMGRLASADLLPRHTMIVALLVVASQAGLVAAENPETVVIAHEEHMSTASSMHSRATGIRRPEHLSTASRPTGHTDVGADGYLHDKPSENRVRFTGVFVDQDEGEPSAMDLTFECATRNTLDFRSSEMGLHMAVSGDGLAEPDAESPTAPPDDDRPNIQSPFHM